MYDLEAYLLKIFYSKKINLGSPTKFPYGFFLERPFQKYITLRKFLKG